MDPYVGKIGKITMVYTSSVQLTFSDGESWWYPLSLVKSRIKQDNNQISEYYEI